MRGAPRATRTDTLVPSTTRFRAPQIDEQRNAARVRHASDRRDALALRLDCVQPGSGNDAIFEVDSDHAPIDQSRNVLGATMRIDSEEHTSELQSLMRISYAVFSLKKTKQTQQTTTRTRQHT